MRNTFLIIILALFAITGFSQQLNQNVGISVPVNFKNELREKSNSNIYQHFILYGQSLSTGNQSYPSLSINNIPRNYMIGNQVWINYGNTNFSALNPLVASMAIADVTTYSLTRNSGRAECPIVGAVNHINLKSNDTNCNYIATSCGTGGTTIEQLSKESKLSTKYYPDFLKAISSASQIATNSGISISCPAIIWMQGEYNYISNTNAGLQPGVANCTDKITYKSLLSTLKNNMQTDIMNTYSQTQKPRFVSYQVGAQYTKGKTVEIGMAQLEFSNENADVICAGPVYPVSDRGGHLDANGYRWYGEMIAKAYLYSQNNGKKFLPLQPVQISRTSDPKELMIKFYVPKLPLKFDTLTVNKVTSYGFTIYNNDVKQSISSLRIIDDCVYLRCNTEITGKVEVVYAGLNTTSTYDNGHGNLRDSDDYPSLFTYVDLDKKNANGSYFYPRDAGETTLHPIYEPRDANGIIYDKPYPLYNFSVAFYYKIESNEQSFKVPNVINSTDAVDRVGDNNNIRIYQNKKQIVLDTRLKGKIELSIYDVAGKLIKNIQHEPGIQNSLTYYEFKLPEGIYIVKATIDKESKSTKLIL